MVKITPCKTQHRTTADTTGADVVKNALDQANHFEGSAEEAQVAMFLKQLGIKYSKLTKDEFVMVFPMNSWAGFSLRFLMLFSLTFNTVQCII